MSDNTPGEQLTISNKPKAGFPRRGPKGEFPSKKHQFKPGQSGNPNGLPKGKVTITSAIKKLLDKKDPERDALATLVISRALKGNFQFFKELIDRHDGPIHINVGFVDNGERAKAFQEMVSATLPSDPAGGDKEPEALRGDPGGQTERQDGAGETKGGDGTDEGQALV